MPNLAPILNEHIRRLARREIKSGTRSTRRLTTLHRRDLASLKRQVTALAKTVAFLEVQEKRRAAQLPVTETTKNARFRADGLRSTRKRLGLSAKDYARLVGVTPLTIYSWETGKSKPRKSQVPKLAALRGLGKREVEKRLALLGKK